MYYTVYCIYLNLNKGSKGRFDGRCVRREIGDCGRLGVWRVRITWRGGCDALDELEFGSSPIASASRTWSGCGRGCYSYSYARCIGALPRISRDWERRLRGRIEAARARLARGEHYARELHLLLGRRHLDAHCVAAAAAASTDASGRLVRESLVLGGGARSRLAASGTLQCRRGGRRRRRLHGGGGGARVATRRSGRGPHLPGARRRARHRRIMSMSMPMEHRDTGTIRHRAGVGVRVGVRVGGCGQSWSSWGSGRRGVGEHIGAEVAVAERGVHSPAPIGLERAQKALVDVHVLLFCLHHQRPVVAHLEHQLEDAHRRRPRLQQLQHAVHRDERPGAPNAGATQSTHNDKKVTLETYQTWRDLVNSVNK